METNTTETKKKRRSRSATKRTIGTFVIAILSIAITAVINNIKSDFLSLGMKNCEVKVFKDLKINQLEV